MVLWYLLLASVVPTEAAVVEVGASGTVRTEPQRLKDSIKFHTHGSHLSHPKKDEKIKLADKDKEELNPQDDLEAEGEAAPRCPTDSQNAPNQKTVRVLSDFHAGGCWFSDPVIQDQVMTLLTGMADGSDPVDELVLLGDIFEFHLTPINESQPHPKHLLSNTNATGFNMAKFNSLIRTISRRAQVYFVRGNHDEEADTELIKLAFGPCVKHMGYGFSKYGIWFEHGHNADLWNRIHLGTKGQKLLPWGYFVTRASHMGKMYCGMPKHRGDPRTLYQELADHFINKVYPYDPPIIDEASKKYMQHTWEKSLLNIMSNAMDHEMTSPEELKDYPVVGADLHTIRWGDKTSDLTLYDAYVAHKAQFKNAIERLSHGASTAMVHAMLQDYTHWAARDTKHDIVISGHTHRPILTEVKRVKSPSVPNGKKTLKEKVVYVNSGGWVQSLTGETSRTYVDFTVLKHSATTIAVGEGSTVVRTNAAPGEPDQKEWKTHRIEIFEYPENSLYSMDIA